MGGRGKEMKMESERTDSSAPGWREIVSRYNFPDPKRSIWQLINSIVPFIGLWILMYYSLEVSYWLTLALAFPTAGFMVRIFIVFHDCGHKSFFKSTAWNNGIGIFTGLFTLTPYYKWHSGHHKHHATVGNLDKRGVGDVLTMTVDEYKEAPKGKRLFYRIYRNPIVIFLIAPPIIFIVQNRFFSKKSSRKEKWNVIMTTLAVSGIIAGISLLIGFKAFLLIELPVLYIATVCGVWLFYVQHQFEGVHWYRQKVWDYQAVSLYGCSWYKLPGLLQFFSGNIGFHHVHHLSSRIPNYKLEICHKENQLFSKVPPLTLAGSLRSLRLRLWDEKSEKLVSFTEAMSS